MRGGDLAVVVLAVGGPPELSGAVRSLLSQGEPLEILVVNSGGGDAGGTLAAAGLRAAAIEFGDRLLPGAARNAGIDATTAPFVAFLAADCIAEPGWAAARLAAHRAGAAAVASAVTNAFPRNLAAWISYVSLFYRRMPRVPEERALRYGASYARTLFARFGRFREDLRAGEDTDFHDRIAGEVDIVWEPRIRTAHRHPTTFARLVSDQFQRGFRTASAWAAIGGARPRAVALASIRRAPAGAAIAWRAAEPGQRRWIAAAAALLPVPTLAYAAGALAPALVRRRVRR